MAQNVYDDPEFFDGYAQLPRSVHGLDGAPEWPAVRAMLPDLSGARVLDLGCGYGWFARWAVEHGAATVLGIDLSERMLARATAATDPIAPIEYRRDDLDTATFPVAAHDLVHSSMTLHYIADLDRLIGAIAASLVVGGSLVCSVEHPILTAPTRPGFVTSDDGHRSWGLDSYLSPGPRTTDWITSGILKHHRPVGAYVNTLIDHGLTPNRIEEWCPTDEELAAHPDWVDELHRPTYLLLSATRRPPTDR